MLQLTSSREMGRHVTTHHLKRNMTSCYSSPPREVGPHVTLSSTTTNGTRVPGGPGMVNPQN